MVPTISWIDKKFDEFNELYFNNELTKCQFKISTSRSQWGCISWRWIPGSFKRVRYCGRLVKNGKYLPGSATIKLSKFYDVSEQNLEETLIHEMIHLEMIQNERCFEGHGPKFRERARKISSEGVYQINVSDSYDVPVNEEVAEKKRKKYEVFILRDFTKNRRLYILGDPSKKKENKAAVKKYLSWFGSIMKLESTCISDHDIFIGRRFSIKYKTNRSTGYYFKSVQDYEKVKATATSWKTYKEAV